MTASLTVLASRPPRFSPGERSALLSRWPSGEFAEDDGSEHFGVDGPLLRFVISISRQGYVLLSGDGNSEPVKMGRSLAEVLP
jgi:hypothetical protein